MIITELKPFAEIIDSLKGYARIFLVGCGECATACKTGGKDQVAAMQMGLEKQNKIVLGSCIPQAPCVAAQVKSELAKNSTLLREADAILVLACGLGAQSVQDNNRLGTAVVPACNSLCAGSMDARGDFYEKCSMCAECVLAATGGICPVTLCSKGLLNGPCGGMNKGKCEVDTEKDCAWVLIYRELEKKKKLEELREIRAPKDFKKSLKPHRLIMAH